MEFIFISYSRKYEQDVSAFAELLRSQGVSVWQDVSGKSMGIPYSQKWMDIIREAIHTASAALVITSEEWDESNVCKDEMKMILNAGLFHLKIDHSRISTDEGRLETLEEVRQFILGLNENAVIMRAWAVTGGYMLSKDRSPLLAFPSIAEKAGFFEKLKLLNESREYFEENNIAENDPKLRKNIFRFIGAVKRRYISDRVMRILSVAAVLAFVIVSVSGLTALISSKQRSDDLARQSANVDIAMNTAQYDEISAMSLLTFDPIAGNTAKFSLAAELDAGLYPDSFIPAGSEADKLAAQYPQQECARFELTMRSGSSTFTVKDKQTGTERSFTPGGKITDHSFDESGTVLALAAGERAYVLFPGSGTRLAELLYNRENIKSIRTDGTKVWAFTDSGSAVVYDITRLQRAVLPRSLTQGSIVSAGGKDTAVYADGGELIINTGNTEKTVDCGDIVPDGRFTALSPDGRYAAVTDSSGIAPRAAVVSVSDAKVIKVIEFPKDICSVCFEGSDKLIAVSYENAMIFRADIATGAVESSEPGEEYGFAVACYEGGYAAVDIYGGVIRYDKSLRRTGGYLSVNSFNVTARQLAVSDKYSCLFASNKGGGMSGGSARCDLSTGAVNLFAPAVNSSFSNSSVCVSADGEYVAYGCPDGAVRVWSVKNMDLLYVNYDITEQAAALAFTDNSELAVLGGSGTLYRLPLNEAVKGCSPDDRNAQSLMLDREGQRIYQKMYELGMTYISPDKYDNGTRLGSSK